MNRKEYLIAQGNVQKDVSALAETLKTQLAVFPEAIKVGEELKVIGFKGETLNDLYLICTRGEDEEVYELKYTILTRKSQDGLTTPSEIPCNETVQEKYKDKLQFIYSIAKNMFVPALVELLLDKTIVLAGEKEVPATFHGVATKTKIKKFALIMEWRIGYKTVILSSEVGKGELYSSLLFYIMVELAQEQTPYILSDLPIQKITSIWH